MLDQLSTLPWIIGGSTLGTILLSFGIVFWVMAVVQRGEARRRELLASGEPAEATVINTDYTGVRVNGRRQIATLLEVRRGGQPPYKATDRYYLNGDLFSNTPIYPPGATVQVRVDPQAHKRVAIAGLTGGVAASSAFSQAVSGLSSGAPFTQAMSGLPGQVSSTNMFMVNGKQYTSLEQMPPEVRQSFAQMGSMLGDANNNGLPNIFEQAEPARSPSERLAELKRMLDQGLINAQEYETKRAEILRQM